MSNTKGTSQRQGYLGHLYNGIFKSLTKEQHCYTKSYHHPPPGATIRLDEASSGNKHAVFPNCKFLISCKQKVKQKWMPWNYLHIFIHLLVSNVYLRTHRLLRGFPPWSILSTSPSPQGTVHYKSHRSFLGGSCYKSAKAIWPQCPSGVKKLWPLNVNKFCAMPKYVLGVNTTGWPSTTAYVFNYNKIGLLLGFDSTFQMSTPVPFISEFRPG